MNVEQASGVSARDAGDVEIDLAVASKACWLNRWFILGTALAFGVLFLVLAIVLPKKYTAWTLVSVAASQRYGGQGFGALSQFSGIARLAGVSLPGNKADADRVALLESRVAIGSFIERENLLPVLFYKRWDANAKRWRSGVRVPTLYQGIRYFQKHVLTVVDDLTTGLITVRIEWRNPRTAARWANLFVEGVNNFAQQRAVARAKRHLVFLNARAQTEHYISQQKAIARLTETELGQEMLASGSEQYAFRVIDPAMVPEKPSFPKKSLFSLLGVLVGCLVGFGRVLLQVRRAKSQGGGVDARKRGPGVNDAGEARTDSELGTL